MIKWARDLPWTRWRSINTPHQVQWSATQIPQKTSAPDTVDVCTGRTPRRVRCYITASCTCKPTSHLMHQAMVRCPTQSSSGEKPICNSLWERDLAHPVGSGACVQCLTLGNQRAGSNPTLRRIVNFPKRSLILSI